MSTTYYDPTWSQNWTWGNSTASGGDYTITVSSTNTDCTYPHHYRVVRKEMMVFRPEKWTEKEELAFVKLINSDTSTGWNIKMLIRGDVLITDPAIETRTMKEFIPL